MTCENIQNDLPDTVRGTASPQAAAAVAGHIARCPACARRAEALARTFSLLEERTETPPPAAYWPSLLPRIHERRAQRAARSLPSWLQRFALPASAALLILLVAVRGSVTVTSGPPATIGEVLGELPAGEIADVQERVESLLGNAVEQETASDKEILTAIIPEEEQGVLYSRYDVETLVEGLNEQESTQLVALLEQHAGMN